MALDQSFKGRTYPPTWVYEVSREKIKEFAASIGDDNPIYQDVEAFNQRTLAFLTKHAG